MSEVRELLALEAAEAAAEDRAAGYDVGYLLDDFAAERDRVADLGLVDKVAEHITESEAERVLRAVDAVVERWFEVRDAVVATMHGGA